MGQRLWAVLTIQPRTTQCDDLRTYMQCRINQSVSQSIGVRDELSSLSPNAPQRAKLGHEKGTR